MGRRRCWKPLALILAIAAIGAAAASAGAAERVVIAVIDGLRSTEGFGDPEARFIPHMANELAPQGALALACDNMGLTITIPGHAAVGSGRYQSLANDGSQRSGYPLLWEYYRQATGASDQEAVIVTTKTKIKILSYSTSSGYGAPDSARVIGPTYDDAATIDLFLTDMEVNRPVIALLNLAEVDLGGHSGNWEQYTGAIVKVDSLIALLWSRIQADPVYANRTALIITGDHGRHADGYGPWSSHGDGCPGCRRIPLLALGPDFPPGTLSETPCEQIDVCRTIGSILDLATPLAQGRILSELLWDPAGAPENDQGSGPSLRTDGLRVVFHP